MPANIEFTNFPAILSKLMQTTAIWSEYEADKSYCKQQIHESNIRTGSKLQNFYTEFDQSGIF